MDNMPQTVAYSNKTTSYQSAKKIELKISGKRKAVYDYIVSCGLEGSTGSEISDATGLLLYTAKPRCTELSLAGYIVDSGKTRKNNNGSDEIVWIAPKNPIIVPIEVFEASEDDTEPKSIVPKNIGLNIFNDVLRRNPHLRNTFGVLEINAIIADLRRV